VCPSSTASATVPEVWRKSSGNVGLLRMIQAVGAKLVEAIKTNVHDVLVNGHLFGEIMFLACLNFSSFLC
jgi:hypothetical protein